MALSSKRSFLYVFSHSLTSSTVSSCPPRARGEHGFTPILKEIVPHSRHAVTIAASYCRRGGGFGFSLKTVGGCPPTNRLLHSGFRLYPGARLILPLSFFTFHSVQGRQRRGNGPHKMRRLQRPNTRHGIPPHPRPSPTRGEGVIRPGMARLRMPLPRVKARGMPNAPYPLLTKEGNQVFGQARGPAPTKNAPHPSPLPPEAMVLLRE